MTAPVVLYGLKNCDTCRRARSALDAAKVPAEFVDIREEADLEKKVPQWLDALGPEALVNRRSRTWRELGQADRDTAISVDGARRFLVETPTLIQRPVIEAGGEVHAGWTSDVRQRLGVED